MPRDDDGEGGLTSGPESVECAGMVKAMALDGGSTQLSRIAERLGLADLDKITARGADVWTLAEWTRLNEGSTRENPIEVEISTCSMVGPECEAPAGYMGSNGGVVSGTVPADRECRECGEPVCSACMGDHDRCEDCRRWDDDDEGAGS